MRRILVNHLPLQIGEEQTLSEAEARHATTVLRLAHGDKLEAIDGNGWIQEVELKPNKKGSRVVAVSSARKTDPPAESSQVIVELAWLKQNSMQWAIEKCVELGASRLVILETTRSVPQTSKKPPSHYRSRWQEQADQGLKQCGRAYRMPIVGPLSLSERLLAKDCLRLAFVEPGHWTTSQIPDSALSVFQQSRANNKKAICVLVGPEGGWTFEEIAIIIQSGAKMASLGPHTLRSETAAIAALSIAMVAL